MIRRDTFIQRYTELNNSKILESEIIELEKYIDNLLVDENLILSYINQNGLAGTNGNLISQDVTFSITNASVHRNPSVLDNGNGRIGINKEFAIWGNNITTTTGQNAASQPWNDLTINTSVTGELRIKLPEHTNKNAAHILVQKYLGPLVTDQAQITQSQIDTNGFWGRKPILGSAGTSALLDPLAVTLKYDETDNRFVMIFKL